MRDFIKQLDFDVLCLQEVPPELLEWLKESFPHICYSIDVKEEYGQMTHVVIVSRYPIVNSETYAVPLPPSPLRAKLMVSLLNPFRGWRQMTDKGAVVAEVLVNGQKVRIYSIHLTIAGPGFRVREFEETLGRRDTIVPEILAGDFNIVEHPLIKIYSWLLGSPLHEGMPWFRERMRFSETLKREKLQNPHSGQITHPFSISQLDHILVSEGTSVVKSWVEIDSHGSDHQPIGVEIELPGTEAQT